MFIFLSNNLIFIFYLQPHMIYIYINRYASPNPRSYDIANHWCEWAYDYNSRHPHDGHFEKRPTLQQKHDWLTAYAIAQQSVSTSSAGVSPFTTYDVILCIFFLNFFMIFFFFFFFLMFVCLLLLLIYLYIYSIYNVLMPVYPIYNVLMTVDG